MSKFSTIKFNAGNDVNGNPRRVYVVFESGNIVATYDEGYNGDHAIRNRNHYKAYKGVVFDTSPSEYRQLIKFKENKTR